MPFVHCVNGAQTTLDPTPAASLAPMAVYVIADPGAGGPLGEVGLSSFNLSHPVRPRIRRAAGAIREIGDRRKYRKKVRNSRGEYGPGVIDVY
jgi:hypothetical protein